MRHCSWLWLCVALASPAQPREEPGLHPVARFPIASDPLTITRAVEASKPFTVAGPYSAVLGEQKGEFEAWLFPVKILSRVAITAELADYPVPIDVNAHAATIEVAPAMTTITYSHAAFTIKQRMFTARSEAPAGNVVLFEIASARNMTLTFRFQPEMQRMWPAPNFGRANAEWVEAGGGHYKLNTDNPQFSAAVAMPRARPGILAPYQERPKTYPVEFKLAFDAKADAGLFFPLLITRDERDLPALNDAVRKLYGETADYFGHFFDTRLTVETPDPQFDRALRWAEIAIDQSRVRFHGETGLVAGYYESGDSARPGFGWFFGRDALWTSYATNAYGDFGLTREALEFLMRRQRADGKIMHEYSQTADLVDWSALPYYYAAADATPLFVMAMENYVNASGDLEFLRRYWDIVRRAYEYTRAHDSDADGIYENTEGTGWVESWPPGMPHQEVYLAALDQQSADAMSRLAGMMGDASLTSEAGRKAAEIRGKLESEYYESDRDFYAFSRNRDGTLDHAATIFSSVAWWSGRLALAHAEHMLERWASAEFSTDWGTRDLSPQTPYYDPISYHQGSVWPLFTGWVSLAEFRAGHPLAGYQHLMQNADLTWAQDLGAVTELLSGEFFQPLGRSSSHQVWSSAMVLSPALYGLFGVEWDALHHSLRLAPHLPATWDTAHLQNVHLGSGVFDIDFSRERDRLEVRARSATPQSMCLVNGNAPRDTECRAAPTTEHRLALPLPAVELEVPHTLPAPGAETGQWKVVKEDYLASAYELEFEAPAGTSLDLPLRIHSGRVQAAGAQISGNRIHVQSPQGTGYQRLAVLFTW